MRAAQSALRPAPLTRLGLVVFGVFSIAAGVLDLIWQEFEPFHQPIQAWGDRIAHLRVLACIGACWLIIGGIAVLLRRFEQWGVATLTVPYAIFTVFPLPRLYTAPHFLGHSPSIYIGLLVAICQQIILAVPAVAIAAAFAGRDGSPAFDRTLRWLYGLCLIDFGLAHLTNKPAVAAMVPHWMPLGGNFWAMATAVAFLLAGAALLFGIQDALAAFLTGAMLLVFSAATLTPQIFAHPHTHTVWGGDAYNLTATGGAWMLAGWLATRRTSRQA